MCPIPIAAAPRGLVGSGDTNSSWVIRECAFEKEGAYMILIGTLPEEVLMESYGGLILPQGRVVGNIFLGEGTGMVFDPVAKDGLLGDNSFSDGARALAFFTPNITLGNWTTTMYQYRAMTYPAWDFMELEIFFYKGGWWRYQKRLIKGAKGAAGGRRTERKEPQG